ncbi:ABC transporter permease [Metabacillus idriensis]|uniref:ABC transporter permease n=1 Tax=Metabacillus idriensis TaxID=324768 RepID=UPI001748F630|nr:ABC-2 family transporter protein [Metabacillus idriensis]
MARYIKMLIAILKINITNIMMYRVNFFLNILDSVIWFVVTLVFFNSIFSHFGNINGWDINDIYILLGASELIKSLMFTLFINNLPYIPTLVNQGKLDHVLFKPINSQFLVSVRKLDFGNLGNTLPAIFLIIYALIQKDEILNIINGLSFIILLLFGILLAYSIWFILMTLSIWLTKVEGMHELFLGAMTLLRYPASLYKGISRIIFLFLIPIVFVSNIPTYALIGKLEPFNVILLIGYSVGFFVLSICFWKFALKFYQSASS